MSKAVFAIMAAGLLAGAGLVAGAALAQVPPDVAARIAALGRVVDPPGTAKIYAPLQPTERPQGLKVSRDIAYGPGPKEVLDLFALAAASSAATRAARPTASPALSTTTSCCGRSATAWWG